ncbi:MAG: PAS domain S-box protein [Gammaproteobacteria bacterium]|nr:PAS domain S-box protein [Gammaproteobacteria bacterium]MBU1969270.1 PAS domain S-box protein [Gammaproteobacteria bacterium]
MEQEQHRKIRILMLEDTPSDAELEEYELRKSGLQFELKRVETRDGFVQALDEFRPDIVLSDYNLPDFSGMAALEYVRDNHPDVPIIMVTGALSDIEAVGLIHAGAKDYVLKDRLARLGAAVQRVLSMEHGIRARKAAEKSLRESEARYRALVESSSDWIWEIDEHAVYTYSSPQVFELLGHRAEDVIGKTPFDLMTPEDATRLREQFAAVASERSHFRLLGNANLHKDGHVVYMETSGTPMFDAHGEFRGYRGIDRDITERKEAEKERRVSAEKLEQLLMQTIGAISATVEARDPYTAGHEQRVAQLASAIAVEMGLSAEAVHGISLASSIHDLGKIRVPAEILSKPGKLSPIEYELVKIHSQTGYDIIKDIEFPLPIALMVLQHHERLDGSGYPQGLKDGQILLEAKIMGVADVVEAMSMHRPYRPGLGIDAALEEISRHRGVMYDADVVDSCVALFREKKFSFDPQ